MSCWDDERMLSDLLDQKRREGALDRSERRAVRRLYGRGLVVAETYANGRHWMLTEAGCTEADKLA